MRYIDRTGKKFNEKGESKDIKKMGALTRESTKKAEGKKLGLLKTSFGPYRIIKECGLGGVCNQDFETLADVNKYLENL